MKRKLLKWIEEAPYKHPNLPIIISTVAIIVSAAALVLNIFLELKY